MELFILYWLFSSLFMCGVYDGWDWKEHPWKCFSFLLVSVGLCFRYIWEVICLNR